MDQWVNNRMRATQSLPRRATYADHLAAELAGEHKHEFLGGLIAAMPGGSDEHNALGSDFRRCVHRASRSAA